MRNPILPTIDRPFPLPDRLLSDGWWVTARAEPVDRNAPESAHIKEGPRERYGAEYPTTALDAV